MGEEEKKLLGLAAFLKEIGNLALPEAKNFMSREILLTHPIKGLKIHEMLMLALITKLQDPCVSEKKFYFNPEKLTYEAASRFPE